MDILPRLVYVLHKLVGGSQGFSSQIEKMNDRFIVVLEHKFKVGDFVV